jgi:hypothetical protein
MNEDPVEPNTPGGLDVNVVERWLVPVVVVGLLACFLVKLLLPSYQMLAIKSFLCVYTTAKIVVLVLRVRQRSNIWPATLAEVGALFVLGYVLWSHTANTVSILAIVGLLLGGGMWRRRAEQLSDSDQP